MRNVCECICDEQGCTHGNVNNTVQGRHSITAIHVHAHTLSPIFFDIPSEISRLVPGAIGTVRAKLRSTSL